MTTKNDHKPTDEVSEQELGLSSAMHDLQSLKESYQEQATQDRELPPMFFGDIQTGPGITLTPKTPSKSASRSDKWRGFSLLLLMLLGLSTSAAAYMYHDAVTQLPTIQRMDTSIVPTQPVDYLGPDNESPLHDFVLHTSEKTIEEARPYQSPESAPVSQRPVHQSSVPDAPKHIRTPKATPADKPDTTASSNSCDEVACLIDPSALCCSSGDEEVSDELAREEELSQRPYTVSRDQAKQAFDGIQRSVNRCFESSDSSGISILTLRIGMEGNVKSSELSEGNAELRSCIGNVAKGLSFAKLKQPFTLRYPIKRR